MKYVNEERLLAILPEARTAYRGARPFPHIVIDGFLRGSVAAALEAAFPRVDHRLWKHHLHLHAHKFACNTVEAMPELFQGVLRELNSKPLVAYLEALTGIPELIVDDGFEGGGMHQITPGGHLQIHADFNYHPLTGHHRRLNLLLYLNPSWDEAWDGNLELWDPTMARCAASIAPILNRCVVFTITDRAYHGHPRPLRCPPDRSRKSLALYYYTARRPREETTPPHSTLYRRTPSDSLAASVARFMFRALRSSSLPRTALAVIRRRRTRTRLG